LEIPDEYKAFITAIECHTCFTCMHCAYDQNGYIIGCQRGYDNCKWEDYEDIFW
jgi:hypothetical protein